jgi:hypothetical protein
MNLEKISVTLYDLIGYLLPGFVLLLACSLAEATFGNTHMLALSRIAGNPLAFSVAAYFLGQACHAIGSHLKDWKPSAFKADTKRMSRPLYDHVVRLLHETYGLKEGDLSDEQKSLNVYLLADSYIVASGGSNERDVLQAREGFFKASMVAFAMLALIFLCSIFVGGTRIQGKPAFYGALPLWTTIIAVLVTSALVWLWWKRFVFFGCLKRNNILLIFLAMQVKDRINEEATKHTL